MPKRREHALLGAGIAVAADWFIARSQARCPSLGELVTCGTLGAVAGQVPDWLEPAVHPGHRSTFHSVGVLATATYLAYRLPANQNITQVGAGMLVAVLAAYGSHLIIDGRTPSGLPLLG